MSLMLTSYTDRDREEVVNLWSKALPLDAITEEVLETRVLLDDNFDPSTFLVVRDGETLCGFVLGFVARRLPMGDADPQNLRSWVTALAVDPDWPISLVGVILLEEIEKRFRDLKKEEVLFCTYPPAYFTPGIDKKANAALVDFLLAKGYREVKQALSMDASIVLFQVPPSVQIRQEELHREGIIVRPYRRTDLLSFVTFLEASMPTDWMRVERANLKKIATGGFRPDQVTVVTKNGEVIGYCQFEGSHFGPFGVSELYQGKGIGTVLLARTLERMRIQGYHDAWVMWTDDIAAKVYTKFGFTETRRFSILRKELT